MVLLGHNELIFWDLYLTAGNVMWELTGLIVLIAVDQKTWICIYRKITNIRATKSPNLHVSRLGFQLSLHNIVEPSVKWRMQM